MGTTLSGSLCGRHLEFLCHFSFEFVQGSLMVCQLDFQCCDKTQERNNVKEEERFLLAHGFRGFSHGHLTPWLLGP
jgi:hypothetical protein